MGSRLIDQPKIRHQLGVALRKAIEKLDVSERVFAERAGVSQKQVNNVVNEAFGCNVEAAATMAKAAGMPLWQLLIDGRTASDASVKGLSAVVHAYIAATPAERRAFDALTGE